MPNIFYISLVERATARDKFNNNSEEETKKNTRLDIIIAQA